ncbi:MAG: hypothetical protein N3C12_10515 [Candidatus Binatia bacterium]|nr:hypothetical protein [Candidatus Binatia bacterium]
MMALENYSTLPTWAGNADQTLILDPSIAWLVVLMLVVVASGLLWLLNREFHERQGERCNAPRQREVRRAPRPATQRLREA